MSIEIVLIPLAVAAVSAWQASRAEKNVEPDGRLVCQVETRMKDGHLLMAALSATGAATQEDRGTLTASWADVSARFIRDDTGIWRAHLTGNVDEDRALNIVRAVDAAYGRQVQAAVLERIRQNADSAGLTLTSESQALDDSITLVLEVNQAGQQ